MQLEFSAELAYADDPDGIIIPVFLSYGGKTLRLSAKVDPGAAVCLFKREHGEELGLSIEDGDPLTLSSFIGGTLEAFGHEITLQTGGITIHSVVYFAKYNIVPRNFLGRQGWLRNLKLGLIDYDNLLYLSDYNS